MNYGGTHQRPTSTSRMLRENYAFFFDFAPPVYIQFCMVRSMYISSRGALFVFSALSSSTSLNVSLPPCLIIPFYPAYPHCQLIDHHHCSTFVLTKASCSISPSTSTTSTLTSHKTHGNRRTREKVSIDIFLNKIHYTKSANNHIHINKQNTARVLKRSRA